MGDPSAKTATPSNATVSRSVSRLREAVAVGGRAGRHQHPAPVRVVAERRRLDERRRRDPSRDRLRLACRGGAGDRRSRARRSHPRRLRRPAGQDRRRPRPALTRRPRRRGGAPLAPFASRTTASFVEQSPSTEIRLKLFADGRSQERLGLARVERVVGRDHDEHRREARMDHPGPLRHPSDGEARPMRDRDLGPGVRCQDRARRGAAALGRRVAGGGAGRPRAPCPPAAPRRSHPWRAR